MVDGPMIFEKVHLEIGRNLCRAITVDVGDQARGMREKIRGVEIENGGKQVIAFDLPYPDVSILSNEAACSPIELPVEGGRAERDARKSRAADDHAIEGEVHSLVAERANDVIFEFGEGD